MYKLQKDPPYPNIMPLIDMKGGGGDTSQNCW